MILTLTLFSGDIMMLSEGQTTVGMLFTLREGIQMDQILGGYELTLGRCIDHVRRQGDI